ncbi:hypothetical protein RE474_06265 [Methanolobus sediminis]|uniref:Uncharacterized protein n=1 Tax=Methanolobus sediminis TaxID=3072978 RepID=A0AA51UN44_9EURY|nr:hypothetical protein [Methanolobus sediminis]WMW26312.1 hypothetical protein RE474_06265 [Methanolobus sediminis]
MSNTIEICHFIHQDYGIVVYGDDILDLHMAPMCNLALRNRCVAPHYNSNICGLSLHFCLKGSENGEIITSISNYIVDVLQSVYPFDRSFLSSFSSRLLYEVKKLPLHVNGPRIMVAIMIEWMSFAALIISSRKMTPANIKVRINSIDCVISSGLQ